jgi:hypothetical protein
VGGEVEKRERFCGMWMLIVKKEVTYYLRVEMELKQNK